MGWWEHGPNGHPFVRSSDDDDNLMMWGDGPADTIGNAIREVKIEFLRDLGRMPSKSEIIAGIMFSTAVLDDLADEPKDAPHTNAAQHDVIVKYGYMSTGDDVRVPDRQIEAGYKVTDVLRTLAVKPDPADEKDGPVWTAVYARQTSIGEQPCGSYDEALDYLLHNWNGGILSPRALIYPDGQVMDRDTLWKILAGRAEI